MLSVINIVHQCTRDRTDHGNVDTNIILQLNMLKLHKIVRCKAIILIFKFTCSVRLFTAFHNIPINSFILSSGLLRPSWMCGMVFAGTDSARDSKCKISRLLANAVTAGSQATLKGFLRRFRSLLKITATTCDHRRHKTLSPGLLIAGGRVTQRGTPLSTGIKL